MTSNGQARRRLLISYAHPDDESFGLGGLIAKYVEEGVEVFLICATNGDVGTIKPEHMRGLATIPEVRLAELAEAAAILKFKKVYLLRYKDSGMMGSPTSQDPESLWARYHSDPEEVIRRVTEVIREVRPQVVITFNKYGGYGHPDHIAIQRATTEAFKRAADPTYHTDQRPYQPQKLYYSNIPKLMIQIGIWMMRLRGQDPRRVGVNRDIDIQAILDNIEPSHTRVNIRQYYPQWDAASAVHISQGGGGGFRLFPKSWRKWISPHQSFTRIYPKPTRDQIDEHDMFHQVSLDELIEETV
ncbi:MAG: PIG-L family deacetylase [Anaerolineae bacterium]|jgi:LmbE family N-acetylglucosaminyl deacetylase|nr:PIG-L family deacetylase [Anaerolineae bacterium]